MKRNFYFRHSKIINASEWMHGDKCQQRCNKIDMLQNYLIRAISIHCRLSNSARSDIPPVYIRSISIKYLAICTSHASESLYHFGLSVIKNIPVYFNIIIIVKFFFVAKTKSIAWLKIFWFMTEMDGLFHVIYLFISLSFFRKLTRSLEVWTR